MRYGSPLFLPSLIAGFLVAGLCSIIGSVGGFYSTALACKVERPPTHALNRALGSTFELLNITAVVGAPLSFEILNCNDILNVFSAVQGFGDFWCAFAGPGHGTMAYSVPAATVSITKAIQDPGIL